MGGETPGRGLDELRAVAVQAHEEHNTYGLEMRRRMQPRSIVSGEDLDSAGLLAGLEARVDACHAAVRDLFAAGVAPEEIANLLGWIDQSGQPEVWKVHQDTHTSWCHFCGAPESEVEWLSLGKTNICNRCMDLAFEALTQEPGKVGNESVVFERTNAALVCLQCGRQPPGPTRGTYTPIGYETWGPGRTPLQMIPIGAMVWAVRVSGVSVALCDRCVEWDDHCVRPSEQVEKIFIL